MIHIALSDPFFHPSLSSQREKFYPKKRKLYSIENIFLHDLNLLKYAKDKEISRLLYLREQWLRNCFEVLYCFFIILFCRMTPDGDDSFRAASGAEYFNKGPSFERIVQTHSS